MKQISPETQELLDHVDDFAKLMKQRLIEKDGIYEGWSEYNSNAIVLEVVTRLPKVMDNHSVGIGIANWMLINYVNSITIKPEDKDEQSSNESV